MSSAHEPSDDQMHALFEDSLTEQEGGLSDISPLMKSVSETEPRYSERQLIASGGMKNIYKVFDQKTGRHVALAELREEMPVEIYEAFLLEARLTALLEHPNIITIHDIGLSADEKPYFSMELKVGDSLQDILDGLKSGREGYAQKISRLDLLNIFIKTCDAVAYAHSRSVIHLDLKPSNIQIGAYGEVLVCDWGLGKVFDNDILEDYEALALNPDFFNDITLTGEIKGTPGYMAPEQIKRGEGKTRQSDIYALGAVLYAILTHEAPLHGDTNTVLNKTLSGDIAPPRHHLSGHNIPQSLSAVAMKALNLDAQRRYAHVNELSEEVKMFLAGFSTQAQNANLLTESSLFIKRHRSACSIAFLALLVAVVGSFVYLENMKSALDREEQSRIIAEDTLDLYKQEQKKSQAAWNNYLEGKKWSEAYITDSSEKLMSHIFKLTDIDVYHDPVRSLEHAMTSLRDLTQNREGRMPNVLLSQQSYIYFIRQQFRESAQVYKAPLFKDVSLLFSDRLQANGLLSADDFSELIQTFKIFPYAADKVLIQKMVSYDGAVRKDRQEHAKIVLALLKFLNPTWEDRDFKYSESDAHLKLSGKNLQFLGKEKLDGRLRIPIHFSYLNTLRLRSLDLSQSDFKVLKQLYTLSLERLDIRGTRIISLNSVKHFSRLKELVVDTTQFSIAELEKVPATITIIKQAAP